MAKTMLIRFRVTPIQRESYENAAKSEGKTISSWLIALAEASLGKPAVATTIVATHKPSVNPVATNTAMPIIQRDSIESVITADPRRWEPGQGLKKR